jgi:hypothetical protein
MFNEIGIKAIICCPLLKQGALRAMMAVHQATPREWTASEIALVEEVVERCWSIIERARDELALRDREEYLRFVIDASNDGIWEWDIAAERCTGPNEYTLFWGCRQRASNPAIWHKSRLFIPMTSIHLNAPSKTICKVASPITCECAIATATAVTFMFWLKAHAARCGGTSVTYDRLVL